MGNLISQKDFLIEQNSKNYIFYATLPIDSGVLKIVNFSKKENQNDTEEINDLCEECKKDHESVSQNLILTGFKLCNSCRISKTIFPI